MKYTLILSTSKTLPTDQNNLKYVLPILTEDADDLILLPHRNLHITGSIQNTVFDTVRDIVKESRLSADSWYNGIVYESNRVGSRLKPLGTIHIRTTMNPETDNRRIPIDFEYKYYPLIM
jgi:hypothetical protein